MDFVDDDRLQIREHQRRIGIAEQQRERFGRGQQYVRRLDPLARLAVRWRVAGAGFDADRQRHLLDRGQEIAADIDRQRLERGDIEGVQPVGRLFDEVSERRQKPGQRLARAGGGDQQRMIAPARGGEHGALMDARRPVARGKPLLQHRGEDVHDSDVGRRWPGVTAFVQVAQPW